MPRSRKETSPNENIPTLCVLLLALFINAGAFAQESCGSYTHDSPAGCQSTNNCFGWATARVAMGNPYALFYNQPYSCCGTQNIPWYIATGTPCGLATLQNSPAALAQLTRLSNSGTALLIRNCDGAFIPFTSPVVAKPLQSHAGTEG